MEFLSAYNCRLSYKRGRENANADFPSRLPIPHTTEDISGSSALTDPDDLGVYLIRACGYTTLSGPIPGFGLGGLTTPSYKNPFAGPNPFLTPILGGLHLTKDDFRTPCAPMPLRRMTGPTTSPFATCTDEPCLSYAINERHEAPRSNCARHTRSRTATLAGNTSLRPDYRIAARSGFAASATPAPPPKASLRSSPPPRSARLDSTISLGRLTLPDPTPGSNAPQLNNSQIPCQSTATATGIKLNVRTPYATPLDATSNSVTPTPPHSPFATTCLHTRGLKLWIPSTSPLKAPITGR